MNYVLGDYITNESDSMFAIVRTGQHYRLIVNNSIGPVTEAVDGSEDGKTISLDKVRKILSKFQGCQFSYNGVNLFETEEICYKVVNTEHADYYISCSRIPTKLRYRMGETTRPEFGKIFVFISLTSALHFYHSLLGTNFVVLKCKCGGLVPLDERLDVDSSQTEIRAWWKGVNHKYYYYTANCPDGTYGADWVTPIELV